MSRYRANRYTPPPALTEREIEELLANPRAEQPVAEQPPIDLTWRPASLAMLKDTLRRAADLVFQVATSPRTDWYGRVLGINPERSVSSRELAHAMNLSHRTVQGYLNRLGDALPDVFYRPYRSTDVTINWPEAVQHARNRQQDATERRIWAQKMSGSLFEGCTVGVTEGYGRADTGLQTYMVNLQVSNIKSQQDVAVLVDWLQENVQRFAPMVAQPKPVTPPMPAQPTAAEAELLVYNAKDALATAELVNINSSQLAAEED
jgi:hypothetical protein